jgi:hypothetical protein
MTPYICVGYSEYSFLYSYSLHQKEMVIFFMLRPFDALPPVGKVRAWTTEPVWTLWRRGSLVPLPALEPRILDHLSRSLHRMHYAVPLLISRWWTGNDVAWFEVLPRLWDIIRTRDRRYLKFFLSVLRMEEEAGSSGEVLAICIRELLSSYLSRGIFYPNWGILVFQTFAVRPVKFRNTTLKSGQGRFLSHPF